MQTNALRVAAYFLIAHYLMVTAFSFLGKGPPDFLRIVISLGILVGAVNALFAPRKRGWVMVVIYVAYALIPSVSVAWAMWMSPELTFAMKVVALLLVALLHSPLIVAVVLVFKPGSFASFKSPLAGDVVKGSSSSKS